MTFSKKHKTYTQTHYKRNEMRTILLFQTWTHYGEYLKASAEADDIDSGMS